MKMITCKNSDDATRSYLTEKGLTYKEGSEGDIGVFFILTLNKPIRQAQCPQTL